MVRVPRYRREYLARIGKGLRAALAKKLGLWALLAGFVLCPAPGMAGQDLPKPVKDRLDEIIAGAYKAAAQKFPCKTKTDGKPKMLRWSVVDRCLNDAVERVDWEGLARQLENIPAGAEGRSANSLWDAVEASLSAHALTFGDVFSVKDEKVLLPLTNSLLKYLPADSLHDLPVIDKAGTSVGIFSGVYTFERAGGLATANSYRLTLFQYTDRNGNLQGAPDKLLLDSFGIPWREARSQRGFRLRSDRIKSGH